MSLMSEYSIGIDTGGTYTDAVLLDSETGKVIAWHKERTTHHDLSVGVGKALAGLLAQSVGPSEVTRLSVSTTLATNAVVEGRGARVGLFVLGYVRHFKLPVVANIFVKGGHTITGDEDEPLDIETLIDTIPGLAKEVDSYAVCGAMSIKNPAHGAGDPGGDQDDRRRQAGLLLPPGLNTSRYAGALGNRLPARQTHASDGGFPGLHSTFHAQCRLGVSGDYYLR